MHLSIHCVSRTHLLSELTHATCATYSPHRALKWVVLKWLDDDARGSPLPGCLIRQIGRSARRDGHMVIHPTTASSWQKWYMITLSSGWASNVRDQITCELDSSLQMLHVAYQLRYIYQYPFSPPATLPQGPGFPNNQSVLLFRIALHFF